MSKVLSKTLIHKAAVPQPALGIIIVLPTVGPCLAVSMDLGHGMLPAKSCICYLLTLAIIPLKYATIA